MALHTFLEPVHLLQTLVLALSIFILVAYLWLACTVWLNGKRKVWITRLGVVGLGLSALFFFVHALLISSPLSANTAAIVPIDFWWHLLWVPAIGVPYIWFAIGLHYAALMNERWRRRRPMLLIVSGVLGSLVLLLLISNASTFTFAGTLRLLAYDDPLDDNSPNIFSPLVLLPLLFLCYVTLCAIGPWFTVGRISRVLRVLVTYARKRSGERIDIRTAHPPLRRALVNAFWDDPTNNAASVETGNAQKVFDGQPLQEPVLSWHLARPVLLLAALLMVTLTTTLGVLGIQSMFIWLTRVHPLSEVQPPLTQLPLSLLLLDLGANGAVALIILLIGYSIVRHGILIERPLARRGFLEQWRGIVIVATAVAIFIALLVAFTHNNNLGGLLLITSLATVAYALFTWSSYTAHDRYIALLGPFLRSTSLRHWLNTDLQKTERDLENLFYHLCSEVLAVQCARLVIFAGSMQRNFSYRWPPDAQVEEPQRDGRSVSTGKPPVGGSGEDQRRAGALVGTVAPKNGRRKARSPGDGVLSILHLQVHRVQFKQATPSGRPMICWVLPIYDERGLVATLYLGPRQDGAAFTDEDMNLAQACGQRILDTLGDHEAMQAVAGLLRRRTVDVKLLGAQQRRVLHDEVLPQMHLALLHLETLRTLARNPVAVPSLHAGAPFVAPSSPVAEAPEELLNEAIDKISDAHRRLAAMMRATALSAPHRVERDGLMTAIHTMLEQDFQQAFDEVVWEVSDETVACIDEITPPAIAELIFAAVQEALRNAARHARGADVHRHLRLLLKASCQADLEVIVADDGVGMVFGVGASPVNSQTEDGRVQGQALPGAIQRSSTSGTGGGLLTHSALLAIAGGSLTIKSTQGEGVTVRIVLPTEALRYHSPLT